MPPLRTCNANQRATSRLRLRDLPPIDGIAAGRILERLYQQLIEAQIAAGAECVDADGHGVVPQPGLALVRAEKPVPPGEAETEVARGFVVEDGMVHPVHVG